MPSTLPPPGAGPTTFPTGVAGDTTTYRPHNPRIACTSRDAGRRRDGPETFVGCRTMTPASSLVGVVDHHHPRPGIVRQATKAFVRHARSKSIRGAFDKTKKGFKRLGEIFTHGICADLSRPAQRPSPVSVKPQRSYTSRESFGPPIPRLSPVLEHVSPTARDQWERDHPHRTTQLDAVVIDFCENPSEPAELPANEATTRTRTSNTTTPKPFPTSAPAVSRVVTSAVTGKVGSFSVNQSQTFESILGHSPGAGGFAGASHAIGLKDHLPGYTTSKALSTGTSPVHPAVQSYIAYSPATSTSHNTTPAPTTNLPGFVDTPDFDAIAQKEKERDQSKRQSWRRGEIFYPVNARAPTQPFRLPSGAVIGASNGATTLASSTVKENQHMKRISVGFLQSGPDLTDVAVGIFAQMPESTSDEVPSPTQKTPVASSHKDTNVQKSDEHKGEETNSNLGYRHQVSSTPQDTDCSPFDANDFPLLNIAARTLSGTGPARLGPPPLRHDNLTSGPSSVQRSATDDYKWQWPRFSDRDYEDPAVTRYRENRARCTRRRRNDTARFEPSNSPIAEFTASEDASAADDIAPSTSTPLTVLDHRLPENSRLIQDISDDEKTFRTDLNDPVSKRQSALLRSIDFTDNTTRSSPPRRRVNPLNELIDF